MARYLLTRLWQSAVTLVLASVVVFVGVRQLPGDPALALAGEEASPQQVAAIRADLGLDDPLVVQYLRFVGAFLRGDLGQSTRTGTPVADLIGATLPVTLWLALYAIVVAVLVGVALGVVAERWRGRWPEWMANAAALVGLSVPNFWLGILAILWLAVGLGIFPASGYVPVTEDPWQALVHLTLPALILGTSLAAVIMRQTRASMIETMTTDYVRTARAKGLGRGRVLLRYGLRNSMIVVVTIVGLQLGGLISGAVVTERIFALPGFGKLTLDAVFTRDYPVVQAVVLVITLGYILINLVVDVLYSVLNPRIRVGGAS
ncbi:MULTISPECIES: ABC transporter permease [unclassified Frigoribacterium]|jgi:peptide/nickel transport system permease protein|uniref:ABC transporter permease n=1 Tax=unclassified Frigoribacterium TaxID=2627005 RepID=UPI000F4842CA|nr:MULTISPECIES: ABC transporter permease [unclassified Frigoribacterium]MBD8583800.1 ABC transporter permease [Frigoribacterium sp. CFBP 8766]MBD8610573.1 ABC transporter permease [Frigoribacterium sp. CFBP 13729]MBF4579984.1 ABC transporter permease [Frigoribacterium sp. VKM Ac-2530]ROP75908.1 peptide/nickel transport system permease protein [Frigoribacterium sp. PhB107]TDT64466.1 peptide/nickel transport system permease protein [Frigoribacterium sp. PhB116]